MEAKLLADIGMEFLKLALRAMARGKKEVPPEEIEDARQRAKDSRNNLYGAIEEHEKEKKSREN